MLFKCENSFIKDNENSQLISVVFMLMILPTNLFVANYDYNFTRFFKSFKISYISFLIFNGFVINCIITKNQITINWN